MAVADRFEIKECPLCLDVLEMDDLQFFPCQCEYQVCRFCWHRIRTDENGLCPACRTPYPENPVNFKPVSPEDIEKMRNQRRKADLIRRQRQAEERNALAHFRIVSRNLIVVGGVPSCKAKEEVLRRQEYFGQFGKILKVVVKPKRQSPEDLTKVLTTVFITFQKEEAAFKAVCKLDNAEIDGHPIRVTLGTTKYCTSFLRGKPCNKADCMYLHRLGEKAARFTAEDMEQGRHVEYQQKLIKAYLSHLEAPQSSQRIIVPLNEGSESRTAWSNPAESAAFVADQRNDDLTSNLSNKENGEIPGELDAFSTKDSAFSWEYKNEEDDSKEASDDSYGRSMHLSPFSLPVYGQTMVDDPRQPVIHIGHGHNEHNFCSCHDHFCEGTILSSLDFALRRALDASLEEGQGAFDSVDPSGQPSAQTDSPITNLQVNCGGQCFATRHRSDSERFCDFSPQWSNESLRCSWPEYPLYPNPCQGSSPSGFIHDSPHSMHSPWQDMDDRYLRNEERRPRSNRSVFDWPPDEQSVRQAHSCIGTNSPGRCGIYRKCQCMGTGSLPNSFQTSSFGRDYDPYLKLQQFHESSSSSSQFRSRSPWM